MTVLKFLFGIIIHLDILLQLGLLIGILLLLTPFRQAARRVILWTAIPFLLLSLTPFPRILLMQLENRFPRVTEVPADTEGFILLGSTFAQIESNARGFPVYNKVAFCLLDFISLMHKYPNKKFVITGTATEINFTKHILEQFNIPASRVMWDERAGNTLDSVKSVAGLLQPKKGEKWAVVTSAFHMPRAVGLFKGAGFNILPYPVDYHTTGKSDGINWWLILDRMNLVAWRAVTLEIAGLINNYLEGHSPVLYPECETAA